MLKNGFKIDDMEYTEKIIEAFLTYNTNKEIADSLGVSVRTVQNYKKDTELKKILNKRRLEIVNSAIHKMEMSLYSAIEILVSIMKDTTVSPQIRLNAVNMLLSFSKNWIVDKDINHEREKQYDNIYSWYD